MTRVPPLLVLAGGFGTRLRTVVADFPKPLAPVCGKPFLQYLIERWVEQGVRDMLFSLHYQSQLVQAFLADLQVRGKIPDCRVNSVVEPKPLGTGGAVAFAIAQSRLTGDFLVANADTWLGAGLKQVAASPVPAIATLEVENSARYGRVRIAPDGTIRAFDEKQDSVGSGQINAGLYHLDTAIFADWTGAAFSLERELFPRLASERRLHAVPLRTDFIDIGVPDDYRRFCHWVESGSTGVP